MFKYLCTLVCVALPIAVVFQEGKKAGVVEWNLASMNDSAQVPLVRSGNPATIQTPHGHAVFFDGVSDGFFLDHNPLASLDAFTLEVLFRPDSGGLPEQRFLHMGEMNRDRVMLETRLTPGNEWYLDAHIRSGDSALTFIDKEKLLPLGLWYHVAVVVRDGQMEVFVNGKSELRGGIPFKAFAGGRTSLGVRQNKKYWFKGAIGRIRITPACLQVEDFIRME